MLVWRFCLRGRLWAVLLVLLATARPARAAGLAWDDWAQARRAELRGRAARPEAIATLAALVQNQDYLAPGSVAGVLRDFLDGKLGGPVDPLVAAQAAYLRSLDDDSNGRFADAGARRKGLGLLGDAWVLGPFDSQGRSGLGRVFPVEEEGSVPDPRSGKDYAGKERRVAWQHAGAEAFVQGALFLDALLQPDSDVVAYCLIYVHSDRDRWAALRVGSSGPLKAWLGGGEILANDVVRSAWLDQDAVPVHLRQGTNLLLLKSVAVRGPWRLFVRLTDGQGAALPGVTLGAEASEPASPAGGKVGKPPPLRDLGQLLRERAARATKTAAAPAWLDQALFLSLVSPADSELRAAETAAKKAVPAAGAALPGTAVQALLLLGQVAREEDDRRAALERALPALASPQQRAHVRALIGNLWRGQRRDDAAVAQWQKALALDPGCVPAQLALAREERRASFATAALARILGLPEAAQRLSLVQDALADALASLGRRREAEEVQRAMLASQRTDVGLLRDLAAAARARGDLAEAAHLYAEAARWRPDLVSLTLDQALVLEGSGDVAGARAVLDQASRRMPGEASLLDESGRLEARAGRIEAALANLRRALELRPQNPGLRRYLETLAAERKAKRETRAVEDLASRNAVDGEALARTVLFGPPPADDASAEVLLDHTVVRVHGNGLAERFVQRLVHARTERAARDGRETRVRFEPGRQEVEIRKARILRAGPGHRLEISEATGRDEENLSEPWYGLYYDTRAAVVSFENLRAGDVVEIQYTVTDVGYRNDLADYFGDFELVADVWPTRRWDYTLIAPAARTFYFNRPRWPGIGPQRETRGAEVRYRFAANHVPRVETEPAMPGFAEVAPYLHVSTYRTWEDVGRWYWSLVRDQMQDDGTLKQAAVRATSGLRTLLDKVKAIHRLVVENTRYVGLEFGIHGYKPYRATQVFERRFGDCKDKATLFVTLLGGVGIDAELVLLRTRRGGRVDETPASLAVFDHAIAYVPGLDLYVDGTAEFSGLDELPAADQDAMALRVSANGVKLVRTPVLPAEKNLAQRKWRVDLHRDGSARIVEDLTVTGQAAHEWRSYYQTPGERRSRFAKAWNGRYPGTQLESVEMEVSNRNRPVVVRSRVEVPQFGDMRDGREAHLPTSSREPDLASTYARLGERHWPLIIGYPWRHEESVSYRLPKGARVVRLPGNRAVKDAFGEFTLTVSKTSDGIDINSAFVLNQSRIAPADYAAFRTFLRETDAALVERVVVDLGRVK
jgi:tetratricopeptide (TPR) repeat protein/transglutaminase-like putative cysteine protease